MTKKQKYICFIGILFCFIIVISYIFKQELPASEVPKGHVGIIKVPPKEKPAKCYKIIRDSKELKGEHNMPVYIGDEIQPFKGKKVRLIYVLTVYGELEITQNSKIGLPEKLVEITKGRISEEKIATTKHGEKDTSCFPSQQFNISPFPPDNTTVLANEPVLFRWVESDLFCSNALLVILGEKDKNQIEIRLGELKSVDASLFKPGEAYKWFIEQDGKQISDFYNFSLLNKADTEAVKNQLAEIEKLYADQSPQLLQAAYLQFISNPDEKLDLYADSLRILYQYPEKSGIHDELFKPIYERCYK